MNKSIWGVAALALAGAGAAHAEDTLKKIKDSGVITEGVRESSGALAFTLGDGKYTGFHYDVCSRIILDIQKQLGLTSLVTKYQLYVEEVRIAVKANSSIKGIADLKDKTVATTTGTTSVQLLRKNKRAQGMDFKERTGKDHSDSFLLLESGRADAFVMDGQILAGLIAKSKSPKDFAIVGEPLSVEPIAIMYRKDDPAFKKAVDDSVRNIARSGEAAKLYDKWFLKPIPPANTTVNLAASDATKAAWANPTDKPLEEYAQPGQ